MAKSKIDEDRLPPARAAAQKRREAQFLALLGRPADALALLDRTPLKPANAKAPDRAPVPNESAD
jgi:hypothetical protein